MQKTSIKTNQEAITVGSSVHLQNSSDNLQNQQRSNGKREMSYVEELIGTNFTYSLRKKEKKGVRNDPTVLLS